MIDQGQTPQVALRLAIDTGPLHGARTGIGVAVDALARDFNATTPDFRIVPEYKGSYAETMRVGLAALDAGDAPHILQVVEIGAATMMGAHGAVKPIYELMRDARQYFDPKSYLPAITSYYSNSNGEMLGFPFNSSSLVMWVNKDALARAGLANQPLETWPQVFAAAKRLQANGYPTCGFSTSWTTWAMIEQFSAWHDTPLAHPGACRLCDRFRGWHRLVVPTTVCSRQIGRAHV